MTSPPVPVQARGPNAVTAPPKGGGAKDLGAWAKRNKTALLAAGGAGVIGVALIMRGRGDGSAAQPIPAEAIGPQPLASGYAAYDSTQSDLYDSYLAQQNAFQAAIRAELDQRRQMAENAFAEWQEKQKANQPPAAPRPGPHPMADLLRGVAVIRRADPKARPLREAARKKRRKPASRPFRKIARKGRRARKAAAPRARRRRRG